MTPVSSVITTELYEVSLVTINRQTSYGCAIIHQDYGIIQGMAMNHTRLADSVTNCVVHLPNGPKRVGFITASGGGRLQRWCWVNFQCRGVLRIWTRVGQGATALAVGAVGAVWTFFSQLNSCNSWFYSYLYMTCVVDNSKHEEWAV